MLVDFGAEIRLPTGRAVVFSSLSNRKGPEKPWRDRWHQNLKAKVVQEAPGGALNHVCETLQILVAHSGHARWRRPRAVDSHARTYGLPL